MLLVARKYKAYLVLGRKLFCAYSDVLADSTGCSPSKSEVTYALQGTDYSANGSSFAATVSPSSM
jgi:hypothetical protein